MKNSRAPTNPDIGTKSARSAAIIPKTVRKRETSAAFENLERKHIPLSIPCAQGQTCTDDPSLFRGMLYYLSYLGDTPI